MNIVHCPEMSRDANGYNKHCRIKALFKVDELETLRHIVSKLNEWRKVFIFLVKRPSFFCKRKVFLLWNSLLLIIMKRVVKVMDDGTGLYRLYQTLYKNSIITNTNSMGLPTPEEKISS